MRWPGRQRAAVSLSFDDARPSQLRCGLPLLERLGAPATFFVLPDLVEEERRGWREAVARGHEIGNHTVTHPCTVNHPWSRHNPLEQMTLADFRAEVCEANRRLRQLLDVEPTAFAYPCGQTFVGRGRRTKSVVPMIAGMFTVGRTFNDFTANSPADVDLAQTRCVNCDDRAFEDLLPLLEAAVADGAWLVLGGHEVGGEAGRRADTTRVDTIEAVVNWCRGNDVWIDTVGQVGCAVAAISGERRSSRWRSRRSVADRGVA